MRTLRIIIQVIKVFAYVYTIFAALSRSRWFVVGLGLWRLLRKTPRSDVKRVAAIKFVNGTDSAIYRRKGWRKLKVRRIHY